MISFISASIEPTQQSNKLFLNPFYKPSMTNNQNYSYFVNINPPDKISSVSSAIISFDVYLTPTVTFNLWVNNKQCNNPTYTVSTTFAGAGQSRISFDCSNVITQADNYSVILKPVGANTGAVNGWLDLTYMNNPSGNIILSGTEYSPNDPATIFVQLKDSQGLPVQNGNCYVDVYYPLTNGTHPYTISDAPMIQASGDDGLYYYDLTAPSTLGVYMLSAKCSYTYNYVWIYPSSENTKYPVRGAVTGTWSGAEINLNNPEDGVYDSCQTSNNCVANYTFNVSAYGNISNVNNINLYYTGESTKATTLLFACLNKNGTYMNLPNSLSLLATGSVTAPSGIDQMQSNSIPLYCLDNATTNTINIRLTENQGSTHALYNNWLSLALLTSTGTIQDVKGSSEMHITNIANASLNAILNNTQIAQNIWNFSNRSLSQIGNDLIANTTWNYSGTINSNILSQFAGAVWNLFNSTYNFINSITESVWSRPVRNLTYFPAQQDLTNYTLMQNLIAQYGNEDKTNYSLIQDLITLYGNQDNTNYTLIQDLVIQYGNDDNANYTLIQYLITQYGNDDNTNYTLMQDLITQYGNTDNVNYTLVQDLITQYGNDDKTNYSLINEGVWNFPARNLTYTPDQNITTQIVNVTDINVSVINQTVNITYQTINVTDVNLTIINQTINVTTEEVNIDEDAIAGAVWTYTPDRNLTYYETSNVNVTINGSDVAEMVWNYNGTISNNILNQFADKIQCYIEELLNRESGEWRVNINSC